MQSTLKIARLGAELWVRGAVPTIDGAHSAVAIVGARAASRRAVEQAHALAQQLAAQGVIVVSGGALGVDAAAHRGALAAPGGLTVAVLGTGVDVAYPVRNRALFEAIAAGRGALLSPFPPGTPPVRWQFPRRNRVIAALVHGVVVVEAQARSGALSTARAAHRLGRRVMACPGSPGCDALLAAGAFAVESAPDVLAALAGRRRTRVLPAGDPGLALRALSGASALSPVEVALRAGLSESAAHAALLRLTLMGYVARLPGERYKRLEKAA